jgi:hypothetical protein
MHHFGPAAKYAKPGDLDFSSTFIIENLMGYKTIFMPN